MTRWPDITEAIAADAASDATLAGIFGDEVRQKAAAQEHRVPLLDYFVVSDTVGEVFETIVIQWTIYAATMEDLISAEQALRRRYDQELDVVIGGVSMLCEFTDGAEVTPPSDENYYARALRFAFQAVRSALQRS